MSTPDQPDHRTGGVRGAINDLLGRDDTPATDRDPAGDDRQAEERRLAQERADGPADAGLGGPVEADLPPESGRADTTPAGARTVDIAGAAHDRAGNGVGTRAGRPDNRSDVSASAETGPIDRNSGDLRPSSDAGRVAETTQGTDADGRERLVSTDRATSYASRWDAVKGEFVDEPRKAVADADALVGELLDELQTLFTEQRRGIEQGLASDETSTEDMRLALRRYRSFFDRLLSI